MPQNILFLVTDQHALHAVSSYGAGICRTPNIDRLAGDGVRFTRAYTPCALCTPARGSLLTGTYPHHHGAKHNTGTHMPFDEVTVGRDLETYPRRLAEQGYRLGYAGKWHAGIATTCHDVGFEGFGPRGYGRVTGHGLYEDYLAARGLALPKDVIEFYATGIDGYAAGDAAGYRTGPSEAAPCSFLADYAAGLIRRFREESPDRPFFVACNFWGPHAPYLPSEDVKDLYDPADIPPWDSFADELAGRPYVLRKYGYSVFRGACEADWQTWSRIVARYYAQVTMIDAALGRLLDWLRQSGLYDDTLIVFTADHGDTLGIHGGLFDKGATPFEEVYGIPMIVKLPGRAGAGQRRDQLVSLLDLTPTFCEAAGTSLAETHGRSLQPLLADPAAPWRDDLMAEFHGHRLPVAQRILWSGRYKYVMNFADIEELYDLQADPAEMTNLAGDAGHATVLKNMRDRLFHNLEESHDNLGPQWQRFFDRPLRNP